MRITQQANMNHALEVYELALATADTPAIQARLQEKTGLCQAALGEL